jgi:hypothetical protein
VDLLSGGSCEAPGHTQAQSDKRLSTMAVRNVPTGGESVDGCRFRVKCDSVSALVPPDWPASGAWPKPRC